LPNQNFEEINFKMADNNEKLNMLLEMGFNEKIA
jgi:adenylate cyclase class IV